MVAQEEEEERFFQWQLLTHHNPGHQGGLTMQKVAPADGDDVPEQEDTGSSQ
ncbi:MAG: hypothetical protein HIU81_06800 [Acidobacteria bacterium]|nr:hypothetical protein [Acidobacteriota bacterium]